MGGLTALSLSHALAFLAGCLEDRDNLTAGGWIFGLEFLKAEGHDLSLDRRLGTGPGGHWENWGHCDASVEVRVLLQSLEGRG